jgi:hypothetical protein
MIGFKEKEFLAIRPATPAGGPSFVGCTKLLIHYSLYSQVPPTSRRRPHIPQTGMRNAVDRGIDSTLILT